MAKPTLNLGCGKDPWGDVRIDVQDNGNANVIMDIDKNYLPFENKYFSKTRLFHVLEHSKNPQRLLNEAIRVSDVVHAKFPCHLDRVPFLVSDWTNFPLSIRTLRFDMGDCLHHILSQIGVEDHPMKHRWIVQPLGSYHKNHLELFSRWRLWAYRKAPRIAKYLPLIKMAHEWECFIQ